LGIARKSLGLTQKKLSDRLGKSVETISNIERGAVWTSLEMLESLARCLGCKIESFFEGYQSDRRRNKNAIALEIEIQELAKNLPLNNLRVLRDLAVSLSKSEAYKLSKT
jgi:transcriptional regulator with XRE-family HTH domain